jgi:hypothetical protein
LRRGFSGFREAKAAFPKTEVLEKPLMQRDNRPKGLSLFSFCAFALKFFRTVTAVTGYS